MKCHKFKKIIYLYLKHELPDEMIKDGKKHLDECGDCKRMLDSLNHYISRTEKYLKSIDTDTYKEKPKPESIQIHHEKRYRLHIQAGIAAVSAAIFLTIISLFFFKHDEIAPVKPSSGNQVHQTSKAISESTIQDKNRNIKSKDHIKVTVTSSSTKTSPEDEEFRKRYKQWLKERKDSAEPVMLVEIHHEFNVREIHFLNK